MEKLSWDTKRLVTFFGQVVSPDGEPVANASVTFPNGIGQTDDRGYFQVDAAAGDVLEFRVGEKDACRLPLAAMPREDDYARLGKVVCR